MLLAPIGGCRNRKLPGLIVAARLRARKIFALMIFIWGVVPLFEEDKALGEILRREERAHLQFRR